uniref:SAM domain-containing protein n=1 Tax=Schizaphis graminum TaxID=13262 RepID=A0A2S2P1D2_SCHGA
MENIMKQWGYSSEIINIFKEEEIDESVLLDLTETMVEQLFPSMGQRTKFLKHLAKLKSEKNLSEEISPAIPKHQLIDWNNIEVELSDEVEHITDNDSIKEIELATNTGNECSIISLNTNLVELNQFSGNHNIYFYTNTLPILIF